MLRLALPELRAKEQQLRARAAAAGIVYQIPAFGGVRTLATQRQLEQWRDEAVAKDGPSAWYPVAPFGKSYHEVGAAFDAKIMERPAGMSADAAMRKLGELGEALGLRWGGRFTRPDPFHFELQGRRSDYEPLFAANAAAPATTATVATAAELPAAVREQLAHVLAAAGLAVVAVVLVRAS